jgi:hypothetical protein
LLTGALARTVLGLINSVPAGAERDNLHELTSRVSEMDHTSVIIRIPSGNGWDIGSLLGYNRGERLVHISGHIIECPTVSRELRALD